MGLEKAREKIGNNVRRARIMAGYNSYRSLAEHLSFSHTKLGNIERGLATASPSDLREIAQVLKVPVEALQVGGEQRQDFIIKIESLITGSNHLEQALNDVTLLVEDSLPGFELAHAKNLQGKVLLQLGKTRKATHCFQKAYDELKDNENEEVDSSYLLFKISANIALAHYNLHEYKMALIHAGRARDISTSQNDRNDMIQLQALCYAEMEEFDMAQHLYELVLGEFQKMGDQLGVARTIHSIGDLHMKEGRVGLAEQCFHQSLGIATAIGYHWGVVGSSIELSKILSRRNEVGEARSLLLSAASSSLQLSPSPVQAKLLYHLSKCAKDAYERMNMLQRAFTIGRTIDNADIMLDICYDLGNLHELANDRERASGYYKIACEFQMRSRGEKDA